MHPFPALVVAVLLALTTGCRSSDYNARVFHPWGCEDAKDFKAARLDSYKHVLMVCIYEDHWEDQGPGSLCHYKGTVVRVYKGDWRISERIAFLQGFAESRALTTSNEAAGRLGFVFTNQHADTEIRLDTGDFFPYNAEYAPALECPYPPKISR
jgi:hypothetical protein